MTVRPGVSLKGAGVGKTIIDATGLLNGLTVDGGSGAQISDLTVRGAQSANVTVKNAKSVTLTRVRATAGSNGIALIQVTKGRVENCVSDHNSFGFTVSLFNGQTGLGDTWLPVSPWLSDLLMTLLRWPGVQASDRLIQKSGWLSLNELQKIVRERIEDQLKRFGRASTLPIYEWPVGFILKSPQHMTCVLTQTVLGKPFTGESRTRPRRNEQIGSARHRIVPTVRHSCPQQA